MLAKKDPPETLIEHTEKLLSVFSYIVKYCPEIPSICGVKDFYEHLFYAIVFHDLGKVATGFQEKWNKWGYRHELLSAGFINLISFVDDDTKKAIKLCVATHHKNCDEIRERYSTTLDIGKDVFIKKRNELNYAFDYINSYFLKIEKWAPDYLNKKIKSITPIVSIDQVEDIYKNTIVWYLQNYKEENISLLHQEYGIFLRGFLITCDHLASANINEIKSSVKNINKQLNINNFYPYQKRVNECKSDIFLSAPTGSGKTESALLWAENKLNDNRLYYVLPYTASINAMYNRFVNLFGEDNVGMLHNKASYFIYMSFVDQEYGTEEATTRTQEIKNITKKFYKPIKIITPFQIIKNFFGVKRWEATVSEMANGVFVFDEIHIYEPRTLALIICVIEHLKKYKCSFLFLSASFPKFIKQKIKNVLPDIVDFSLDMNDTVDKNLMCNARHKVKIIENGILDNIELIQKYVESGKKVLVICNTVNTAQQVFQLLNFENKVLLHGRFILKDRERIEKDILNSLPNLLVGTQVIEVSLDLDFDTIFTEPAPINALTQRFGRVNRKGGKGIVPVHIFRQGSKYDKYFYDENRIERTLKYLTEGIELSQTTVNEIIEKVYLDGYTESEDQLFKNVYNSFSYCIKSLVPFTESDREEEYFDLIKNYQVIPSGVIEQEYINCLSEKRYFESIRYFVNITVGQAMGLNSKNACTKRTIKIDDYNYSYFVVDAEYDNKLGLLTNKVTNQGIIID
jgi:CRISPR-associated endonuclease/helicase Cas3